MTIFHTIFAYILTCLRQVSPLGQPILIALIIITLLTGLFSTAVMMVMIAVTIAVVAFYQDPSRPVPMGTGMILAPLDGYITAIEDDVALPILLDQARETSPIFRQIHLRGSFRAPRIIRAPLTGTIKEIIRASDHDTATPPAWPHTDDIIILLADEAGREVVLHLTAHVVPHALIITAKVGDMVQAGDRLGLALFTLGAVLYIPQTAPLLRTIDHGLRAGETVLMAESFTHKPLYRHV